MNTFYLYSLKQKTGLFTRVLNILVFYQFLDTARCFLFGYWPIYLRIIPHVNRGDPYGKLIAIVRVCVCFSCVNKAQAQIILNREFKLWTFL